ncbi:D-lactate dehydrogenase [Novosphingobium cyanobacteriorum]|uniref:D-lactate dehydrogenase n=1 Tax=Novosphingobium cyanobacteriorum TaxID=3024215 RepID=A0ABT6CMM5_9SPHN|nr:D-lactate dehydrogenase [Novosphingobium cyanobacteriorum]MDF8335112.1 D-lactate dehydrogenase [Novosphingobium cyanobacteriorum]
MQGRALLAHLRAIVGRGHVITAPSATRAFTNGYRTGSGTVLAVVRPGSLVEMWHCARACVTAGCIIIVQAANTGLTGGSTPAGGYDRPVVLISTLRIDGIIPILDGQEAICLAGATLTMLEDRLAPYGRVPHSVIGSTCLGASVVGGICNNSGGALVSRGPAFTRHALYARVDENGRLELVNRLGVLLPDDPEAALALLDGGTIPPDLVARTDRADGCSAYEHEVRDIDRPTPARFNADSRRHFGASGSAGKVVVFAVRTETFPAARQTETILLATNDPNDFAAVRRHILGGFQHLPTTAEYMHRNAATLAASHGNDICLAVQYLGARRMPFLLAMKLAADRVLRRFGSALTDRLFQAVGRLAPHPLPAALRRIVDGHEHLLLLSVADDGIAEARRRLSRDRGKSIAIHTCTAKEAAALQRLRFATAGATIRFAAVERAAGALIAIDCALPRNRANWQIALPDDLARQVLARADYGHFLCHVFHLDFILRPGSDAAAFEAALLALLSAEGIMCPAEHSFGHHYPAPENVVAFYRALDPTNTLNPGIGQTSRGKNWT